MPSCSKSKNPRNIEITFEEDTHRYTSIINEKELIYTSGTLFVAQFFPQFDPTGAITRACARKRGITVESLKQQWKDKAEKSCIYGTKIHETCEDTLLKRDIRNKPGSLKEELSMKNAIEISKRIAERADIIGIEKIIFDERIGIAGTMDIFLKSKKNGQYIIGDWKTNEHIDVENKYKKFGLPPIEHIPAINFHEYAMQLNLYEYILKNGGYVDKEEDIIKVLFHITEKGVKSYHLPNYQKEISDMMKVFLTNKK